VAELVSDIGAVDGRLNTVVRAGARVDLSDRITIDAAAGAGLTRSSPDLVTTLGPTLKF